MEKHKCAECGFLAGRNKTTRELEEIEGQFRSSGDQPKVNYQYGNIGALKQEPLPVCFARSFNLHNEIKLSYQNARQKMPEEARKQLGLPEWKIYVSEILSAERECKSFTDWQQGFTPKEHREILDRKIMMEMEENRRKNDRKWHWIELIAIIIGTGFFTLLGAWIARMN